MFKLKSKLRLVITDGELDRMEAKIKEALRLKLFETIGRIEIIMRRRVKLYLYEKIKASETYDSLVYGSLRHELGLLEPKGKLDNIIDMWASNLFFHVDINKNCVGSIKIGLFRSDYQDVLDMIESHYLSTNRKGKISIIEWLRWLLLEGSKPIILHHAYVDKKSPYSRTGYGLMIRRDNFGKSYSIPPEHAGVQGDNFATRAVAQDFVAFLEKAFKYHFAREFV